MSALSHIVLRRTARSSRAYCELDRWSFDPRYTDGVCPICGWAPAGAAAAPRWLRWFRRVEWDLVGLFALFVALTFVGVLVAYAAGIRLPIHQH
ncbi:MAG: hypothetical protein E6J02_00820 [Chloroflexi bacterium]|nr:MAG: hypothetical protein E6J02_00820 [Chloroflexota bacterium]TME14841.1 MAG: hypothetical protein E6I63_11585 [Chloroflexota bacterium]TME20750.1 MAG: hypothetical protein E6I70_00550 [Chloroflexota bacterium]